MLKKNHSINKCVRYIWLNLSYYSYQAIRRCHLNYDGSKAGSAALDIASY